MYLQGASAPGDVNLQEVAGAMKIRISNARSEPLEGEGRLLASISKNLTVFLVSLSMRGMLVAGSP